MFPSSGSSSPFAVVDSAGSSALGGAGGFPPGLPQGLLAARLGAAAAAASLNPMAAGLSGAFPGLGPAGALAAQNNLQKLQQQLLQSQMSLMGAPAIPPNAAALLALGGRGLLPPGPLGLHGLPGGLRSPLMGMGLLPQNQPSASENASFPRIPGRGRGFSNFRGRGRGFGNRRGSAAGGPSAEETKTKPHSEVKTEATAPAASAEESVSDAGPCVDGTRVETTETSEAAGQSGEGVEAEMKEAGKDEEEGAKESQLDVSQDLDGGGRSRWERSRGSRSRSPSGEPGEPDRKS
eukprot:RCo007735